MMTNYPDYTRWGEFAGIKVREIGLETWIENKMHPGAKVRGSRGGAETLVSSGE